VWMVVGWARWLDVGQCVVVKVLSVGEGVIYLPVVLQAVRMCDGLKGKGSGGWQYLCLCFDCQRDQNVGQPTYLLTMVK
jgi:hypothetical protein